MRETTEENDAEQAEHFQNALFLLPIDVLRGRLQILGVVPIRNEGGATRCNGDEGRNTAHRTAHVTDGAVIHTILPGMSLRAFPPHDLSRRVKYLLRR